MLAASHCYSHQTGIDPPQLPGLYQQVAADHRTADFGAKAAGRRSGFLLMSPACMWMACSRTAANYQGVDLHLLGRRHRLVLNQHSERMA